MNGEDDDGNPVGSTAFQHAERMAALAIPPTEIEKAELLRQVEAVAHGPGIMLLRRLLSDHDRLNALALSATARADAAEAALEKLRKLATPAEHTAELCQRYHERADLAARRLAEAEAEAENKLRLCGRHASSMERQMSATICWRPTNKLSKHFKTGTGSQLEVIKRAIGSRVGLEHVIQLRAMAIATDAEFYNEVADLIERVGEIELWVEY